VDQHKRKLISYMSMSRSFRECYWT